MRYKVVLQNTNPKATHVGWYTAENEQAAIDMAVSENPGFDFVFVSTRKTA